MKRLTLRRLYNTGFKELYWKFLATPIDVDDKELETLLSLGLYFTGLENEYIQKLGYRLFLLYSKHTKNYKPLYELSLNKGLIPISQYIYENLNYGENFGNVQTMMNSAVNKKFKTDNQYKTIGQRKLYENVRGTDKQSYIVVAPTSYGKTELILTFLDSASDKNICILTPTKSLLAQTKKRILNHIGNKKIITQPEMYCEDETEIIAVLTQERLLRLLQNNPKLKFDILVIDEAHNLLEKFSKDNSRSVLLASVIIICYKRNENLSCRYLTPFLKSRDSILLSHIVDEPEWFTVSETMKSEVFIFHDILNGTKEILDQFSGAKQKLVIVERESFLTDVEIVCENSGNKNIVYLNSPKKIELFSEELTSYLTTSSDDRIKKAVSDLREFIHEDYKLANSLEHGVIYHHGSVPEVIRYYIESLYSEISELRFIVANSTLLEGVNFPAIKMFILDPSRGDGYLKPADFKNLIGRICRFGDIFNPLSGNLDYLLPEIHIIKGKYCRDNFNAINFFKERNILVEDQAKIEDEVLNPLLRHHREIMEESIREAEIMLDNFSEDDIVTDKIIETPKTNVGKLCFQNNVRIFDILDCEESINDKLSDLKQIQTLEEVFDLMNYLFFSNISEEEKSHNNIKRLKEYSARKFYIMLINWRMQGLTLKSMISRIVAYWNSLNREEAEYVYVGKWGDKTRGISSYRKYWTDIFMKSQSEKINLAIVRLKEEFDFIDNEIIKYVEILHSLELIEEELYLKIKYGTSNKDKISLLNCGISNTLSNILFERYKSFYTGKESNYDVFFESNLVETMKVNKENGILISEILLNSASD